MTPNWSDVLAVSVILLAPGAWGGRISVAVSIIEATEGGLGWIMLSFQVTKGSPLSTPYGMASG